EAASTTGLRGLAAYLWVVIAVIVAAVNRLEKSSGLERVLLASFLAAFAAYLTQAAFSIDVPPLAALGWVLIGSLVALADPAVVARREQTADGPRRRRDASGH